MYKHKIKIAVGALILSSSLIASNTALSNYSYSEFKESSINIGLSALEVSDRKDNRSQLFYPNDKDSFSDNTFFELSVRGSIYEANGLETMITFNGSFNLSNDVTTVNKYGITLGENLSLNGGILNLRIGYEKERIAELDLEVDEFGIGTSFFVPIGNSFELGMAYDYETSFGGDMDTSSNKYSIPLVYNINDEEAVSFSYSMKTLDIDTKTNPNIKTKFDQNIIYIGYSIKL